MNTNPKKIPATAAGQALGYSLQFTRLTAMLLEAAEGSMCSLEVLDDIAEETIEGMTKLGQTKSALTTNPVADRAINLWKTLFNWLELVKRGIIDPSRTVFELYVSRQVDGELIKAFHSVSTPEEAQRAINLARARLWGSAPDYIKKVELPEDIGRYVNPVLDAEDELLLPVIKNLRLVCGSGSPQADIEAAIRRGPVSEAKVFDIANQLCGWVFRNVVKQLEQGVSAYISRDEFHHEYIAYVRRVDRELILKSWASLPTDEQKEEQLPRTFVQQLNLIEHSFDDQLEAISDFLRASWDRAIWSRSGEVHEDAFSELNETLHRTWSNIRDITNIDAADRPPVLRGKLLHLKCMEQKANVQGMEPPPHFVPGCFHILADDMVIGWHPDYQNLLKTPVEDK